MIMAAGLWPWPLDRNRVPPPRADYRPQGVADYRFRWPRISGIVSPAGRLGHVRHLEGSMWISLKRAPLTSA